MTQAANSADGRSLLLCGVVAGPIYVAVTLIQAFTREGFDITQHRFTQLTAGEFGWVHQTNMILVGLFTLFGAVGMRRVLAPGRSMFGGPIWVALLGIAYAFGGLLTANPVVDMPPGTTVEMVQSTFEGQIQNASRGISTLFLIIASLARSFGFFQTGERRWALITATLIPISFAALTVLGYLLGGNPVALAFLATPWIWLTTVTSRLFVTQTRTS